MRLFLASKSPRRQSLLKEAGVDFSLVNSDADEIHDESLEMENLCQVNAKIKAWGGLTELVTSSPLWGRYDDAREQARDVVVLGADTLVFLEGRALGKPKDVDEARSMLRRLSGEAHFVCTGVCLLGLEKEAVFSVVTEVVFKELSDEVIDDYMSKVDVMDKAGAYAFQEHGEMIIAMTCGDTNNVIGLPVDEVVRQLTAFDESLGGC